MKRSRKLSFFLTTSLATLLACSTAPAERSQTAKPQSGVAVSPSTLAFTVQQGGSLPSAQTLNVSSSRASSFTASSSNSTWLGVSPASGTTPGTVSVSVKTSNLTPATYNATVTVSSKSNTVTVPVSLTVTSASTGGGGGGTSGTYVLLAWSELGMHCMDGKDYSVFSVLPPYNTIYAKLLKKGSTPAVVSSGVTITYAAMKDASGSINTTSYGNSAVAQKTNFWNFVRTLFLGQPLADVGLHNYPVQSLTASPMTFDSTGNVWKAEGIPTVPYDDSGASKAYPLVQVIAKDSSGQVLATTTVVPAVSDEMSCQNCHAPNTNSNAMPAGGWVTQFTAAQNVKFNILKKHDEKHPIPAAVLSAVQAKGYSYQSSLYQTASSLNNPVLCASCHASNALNAAGMDTGVKNSSGQQMVPALTASMHTTHSSGTNIQGYAGRLTECASCHTSSFATSATGGPHGMHTVGPTWVSAHHNYLSGGTSQCTACHGADYRGSSRSKILTARTFSVEGGSRSFAAGHQISCYDCHNGPNGG